MNATHTAPCPHFELRFRSLFHEGRALDFPCDANGDDDVATLPERARRNYLHALAVVGREFSFPSVLCTALH